MCDDSFSWLSRSILESMNNICESIQLWKNYRNSIEMNSLISFLIFTFESIASFSFCLWLRNEWHLPSQLPEISKTFQHFPLTLWRRSDASCPHIPVSQEWELWITPTAIFLTWVRLLPNKALWISHCPLNFPIYQTSVSGPQSISCTDDD